MAVFFCMWAFMVNHSKKMAVLSQLKQSALPLTMPELSALIAHSIPERTLRRWLSAWVDVGIVQRMGQKRGTRYHYSAGEAFTRQHSVDTSVFTFLTAIPEQRHSAILEQLRDLWTHHSTALEGNTFTLGDTHAVLGLGLTVSGKPLKEHQEILGHAKAIDILYQAIYEPLNQALIYILHQAVQTETVMDIYKPVGAWKVEVNGTYTVTSGGNQVFIEYAHPVHIDALMTEVIDWVNSVERTAVTLSNAAIFYAKVHMAIVHIHPFWDGNGRMARLLANIILLKSGFPPLVIEQSKRREYIECLADYQIKVGQLTDTTGAWPDDTQLEPFELFCQQAYAATKVLIEKHSSVAE